MAVGRQADAFRIPLSPGSGVHSLLAASRASNSSTFGSLLPLHNPLINAPPLTPAEAALSLFFSFPFSQTSASAMPVVPFALAAGSRASGITLAKATGFGGYD